jgi:sugar lactone lactonase YvrE
VSVYDPRVCALGEGPLWHPQLGKLFWFDILGKRLLCDDGRDWQFDEHVSAAGWIDDQHLLIASESKLFRFNLETNTSTDVVALEAENSLTRSNDGRADPWGGFWIGTMGKNAEAGAGAIYRMYDGKLRKLFGDITISNSICFSPDRKFAYATDSKTSVILRIPLDAHGFPAGDIDSFIDLSTEGLTPDGSVVAADGSLLNAQWGAGRVARYDAAGEFIEAFKLPTDQTTCPALGGDDLTTLLVTSAAQGLEDQSEAGMTFSVETQIVGQKEYQVRL